MRQQTAPGVTDVGPPPAPPVPPRQARVAAQRRRHLLPQPQPVRVRRGDELVAEVRVNDRGSVHLPRQRTLLGPPAVGLGVVDEARHARGARRRRPPRHGKAGNGGGGGGDRRHPPGVGPQPPAGAAAQRHRRARRHEQRQPVGGAALLHHPVPRVGEEVGQRARQRHVCLALLVGQPPSGATGGHPRGEAVGKLPARHAPRSWRGGGRPPRRARGGASAGGQLPGRHVGQLLGKERHCRVLHAPPVAGHIPVLTRQCAARTDPVVGAQYAHAPVVERNGDGHARVTVSGGGEQRRQHHR